MNGVKTIQMTQTAYNTELYEIFKEHTPKYTPKTPFPETVFLSLSNPDGKRKEVPQEEVDAVYARLYEGSRSTAMERALHSTKRLSPTSLHSVESASIQTIMSLRL